MFNRKVHTGHVISLHVIFNCQLILSAPGRPKAPVGRPRWTSDDEPGEFSTALLPYLIIFIIFPITLMLVCICAKYSIRWLTRKLTNQNRNRRRTTATLFFPLVASEGNILSQSVNFNRNRNLTDVVNTEAERIQISSVTLFSIPTATWRPPVTSPSGNLSNLLENDPPPKYLAEEPPPSYDSLFVSGNKD